MGYQNPYIGPAVRKEIVKAPERAPDYTREPASAAFADFFSRDRQVKNSSMLELKKSA